MLATAAVSLPLVSTISERLEDMQFTCSHPDCNVKVSFRFAIIPDLTNLYLGIRKDAVDQSRPLTARELASEVRCQKHPLIVDGQILKMYALPATAGLMDRWVRENSRRASEEQRWRGLVARQSRSSRPRMIVHDFVNETLSRTKPREDKPRPKYRQHRKGTPKPPRDPNAPKRYGDEIKASRKEEQQPKKGKKKSKKHKGGNDQ